MAHLKDDGNGDLLENYEPALPAWYLMKEHIPESELPEIRGILGGALIDLCTDMYSEVEACVQIWKDVCCKHGSRAKTPRSALADSPVIKELLTAEIRMLLQALKEKSARDGRDEEEVMSRCSPTVVSYVLSSEGRPRSAGSCLERQEIPSRPQSALSLQEVRSSSSSRLSTGSASEDLVDAVKHKLNLKDIHEIVSHLQSILTDDLEAMRSDIQFLQECIEQRHRSRFDDQIQEPTVSELKEERRLIEKELKLEDGVCSPGAASLSPADDAIREGSRSPGWMCGPLSGAAVHSPPPITPKEKPLLARSPRPPGEPTSLSPTRILRTCRLSPRCSDAHELRSVREDRLPNPANSAGSSGLSSDLSFGLGGNSANSHPETGCHSQEQEKPDFATTRLSRYNPSGSPFPSNIIKPRPPAPSARDNDPLTASPSAVLVPAPPAEQKPATRGQSVSRRLRLPQGGLVSPT